jgi:uncharacterized spore protein YtfJ
MNVEELMNRVGQNLSVGRAFGAAYEKDGTLVIPVALVAGGGGGGEGTSPSGVGGPGGEAAGDGESTAGVEPATGSGGGFGGVVMPVGAYVVKDGAVRWMPAVNVNIVILAGLGVIRLVLRARRRARRRRRT